MYVELDESTKTQLDKLRNEGNKDMSEITKKYDQSLKKKDENLKTLMLEIDQLKSTITHLKTEILERKADEELRLNDKVKDMTTLERQFREAVMHEQETKLRQSQAHNERVHRLQEDHKTEMERLRNQHQYEIDSLQSKVEKAAEDQANEKKELAKSILLKNQLDQQSRTQKNEIESLK